MNEQVWQLIDRYAPQEFAWWWSLHGELTLELMEYFALCSVVGLLQGLGLGNQLIHCVLGKLP